MSLLEEAIEVVKAHMQTIPAGMSSKTRQIYAYNMICSLSGGDERWCAGCDTKWRLKHHQKEANERIWCPVTCGFCSDECNQAFLQSDQTKGMPGFFEMEIPKQMIEEMNQSKRNNKKEKKVKKHKNGWNTGFLL